MKTYIRYGLFGTCSDIIKMSTDTFQKHRKAYKTLYGQKFDRLLVVDDLGLVQLEGYQHKQHACVCLCDCGNIVTVLANNLKRGATKSCGCLLEEMYENGLGNLRHGLKYTRIYYIYYGMRGRCYNPNNSHYQSYGGRGITVCDEWMDKDHGLVNFYNWAMENGYSEDLTLDRINVDGNYEPSNCKWSTTIEQANNKRSTVYLTYKGETMPLNYWAEKIGMKKSVLRSRYYNGWTSEEIFETPLNSKGRKKNL